MTTREELVSQVSGHLHAGQRIDAARLIASFAGQGPKSADNPKVALELCNSLFYWCLNNGHYEWGAQMLWTPALFDYRPRCTQLVWREMQNSNALMLMGAASMSKSYGGGAWLLLDWLRDPMFTSVNLVGPSEDHLKDNLFTHILTMHQQSTLPLPGISGELFLGLNLQRRQGSIRGIVIPLGKKPSARLQGRKRVPRPYPHPTLGPMSRIRFFLDEFEKIPLGIWKDIDNVFSNLDSDVDGFKLVGAFNPEDPAGQVAVRCEPPGGWQSFNPETDEVWNSKRGWRVLRLDAAKCENVVAGKVVFPGLQSKEGFDKAILNSGGRDTPGYWTMCRACFPRSGTSFSVVSETVIDRARKNFIFAEEPIKVCGGDLALEGDDSAELAFGRFGKVVGYRVAPTPEFPKGREVLFKTNEGRVRFRWGLQVDEIVQQPKADTVKMATSIKEACWLRKVKPAALCLDRTGNGAGVHDLLKSLWSEEVRGVNYTEAATDMKILEEDTKTAHQEYERVVSELWFALKKWAEFNFIAFSPTAFSEGLKQQLVGRHYRSGKLTRVESKGDYKARGFNSPNQADALTLLIHAVRLLTGVVPSALDSGTPDAVVGLGTLDRGPMPVVVDATNEFHNLDDEDQEGDDFMN